MIKLFFFWIKSFFMKPKPKDYIYLIKKFDNNKYLCVINGRVFSITENQYKNYLKNNT
jgi:hypothetical protein